VQERPYAPGWLDLLLDRIDRAPGPNLLYVLGLLFAELAWLTGVLWANGKVPVGTIDFGRTFLVVVAPYLLWARFHLDRVAGEAMDRFRPALEVSDSEFRRLRYELTTLPAQTTWIITGIAVLAYGANITVMPESIVTQFTASREESVLLIGPLAVFTLTVLAVCTAQAARQLWMVDLLHGLATRIDLFRAKPLYAFSGLAARTGMSFALLAYFMASVRPDMMRGAPALKLTVTAMVPTAIACFVLPLRGMHLRLVAEKDRMIAEAGARYAALLARLHECVDQGVLTDADKLNNQLSSIAAEREALARVSTWPWEPATLTGFVSALIFPVALWAVQRLLTRLGF
jgi:hypothetical protein